MLEFDEIVDIQVCEEDECYDIKLLETDVYLDEPNFVAEGIVVHNCGMTKRYVERKKGREKFSIHPLMQPILEKTYGIMVYQEQIMQVLHKVGNIPLKDCEAVRKAISKKKIEAFIKYKEMFVINGQKNLQASEEYLNELWGQVETFSEYGFNKCITKYNLVFDHVREGYVTVGELYQEFQSDNKPEIFLDSFLAGETVKDRLVDVFETGQKEVYEIELDNGIKLEATLDHKFLCADGQYHTVQEIFDYNLDILWDSHSI